jgi:AcrR family transcriptional regulator
VLYHHFINKAGLFAVVARHVNWTVVDTLRQVTGEGDLADRLRAALVRSAGLQASNRSLVRFLATAPLEVRFHPELRDAAGDLNGVLDFFTELCRDHAPPGADPEACARVARVHLHGLARVAATVSAAEFRRTVDAVVATLDGPPFRPRS